MCSGRSKPNLPRHSRVGASKGESCRLAGATCTPTGMPCPSTMTERLVPCLPRSTGEGPAAWPPQGALTMQPSNAQVLQPQADDLVIGIQGRLLQGGEHSRGDPLTRVCVGWWPLSRWSQRPSRRPPQHQDLDELARARSGQICGPDGTPAGEYRREPVTARRTGPTRAPSPMMARRAQGDTPRNRSKYRQLTSYRDLATFTLGSSALTPTPFAPRYLVGGPGWSGAGPVAVGMMSCPCP